MALAVESWIAASGMPYALPNTKDFEDWHSSYIGNDTARPLVIARPRNGDDVSGIVKSCVQNSVDIVVRGGGHDLHGRFTAANAVSIDLRDLNTVIPSDGGKTVRIGGGSTARHILEELKLHNLQIPTGGCANVGINGWSLIGGYGPLTSSYGLGVDQIVGAKIVNAQGDIIDATEEMLTGMRGGGGNFGIVVELTSKAYPFHNLHAGQVAFQTSNLTQTLTKFFDGYYSWEQQFGPLPDEFWVQPLVWQPPGQNASLIANFVWNGEPSDESALWLNRTASLGTPVADPFITVKRESLLDYLIAFLLMLPAVGLGSTQTASLSSISGQGVASIVEMAAKLPADVTGGLGIHLLRQENPSFRHDIPSSVFPNREPHVMLEIMGMGIDATSAQHGTEWAIATRDQFLALPEHLDKTYPAMTDPSVSDPKKMYGDKYDQLMSLKKQFDPTNVFKHAVPKLGL
ncbi:Uncharacterized protein TCAP_00110 [Tolypocladium capitatum]|uniref:FAD-binding PCMH-type domain-containing protein n=1 Tax=Tolypocladium capitatum TaxID=45235 RepID=A0A2K3QQZ9_9HYPO|nr:Uncharacterized protein TCAP_00110 [Tolypocladium capitatum]